MPRNSIMRANRNRRPAARLPRSLPWQGTPPPPFSPDDVFGTSFRYNVTTGTQNMIITRQMMLNLLVFGVNSTTAYRMFSAVRITRIRVWSAALGSATNSGSVAISSLQWAGQGSRPRTIVAESMGVTVGHLDSRPPPHSQASFWSNDNYLETDVLFTLDVNSGDVIQIDVACSIQNGVTAQYTAGSITTTSTLATGKVYQPTLDHYSTQFCLANGRLGCL